MVSTSPWYLRRHGIHIVMFANLLEARAGAWSLAHGAGAWSMVARAWSLEPGLWRMELVAGAWSLAHGAGAWSWSLEPGAWSLESGAGAWSTWSWSLAHGACDSDVTGSTLISLKYFYFPLQHFPLQ